MHVSEFRIGNWVYSLEIGGNVQISSISEEAIHFKDCVTWDYPTCEEIVPIKLTEEILLKCGFEEKGTIFRINKNTKNEFDVYIKLKTKELYFGGVFMSYQINHVHQLQNLHFALTGEELTVNL